MQSWENLVMNNRRLVYFATKKFYGQGIEIEDLNSIGFIGLVKAAKSFDAKKGKFQSYAFKCIKNELLMELRKNDGKPFTISLDQPIPGINGENYTVGSTIMDERVDIIRDVENMDMIAKIFTILMNTIVNKRIVICILLRLYGMKQEEIKNIVGCSQVNFSRIFKKNRSIIMQKMDEDKDKEAWRMDVSMTKYTLTYTTTKVKELEQKFITLLEKNKEEDFLDFRIIKKKEKAIVIMTFPKDEKIFLFIAKLINEMEGYNFKISTT